ncbi:MAG: hypothetical protein WC796_02020 [Candidatus Pacearchaeota archaeon]|jgi:hypothetical protein
MKQKRLVPSRTRTVLTYIVGIPLTLAVCGVVNELRKDYQNFREEGAREAHEWFYHQPAPTAEEREAFRGSLYRPDSTYLKIHQLGQQNQSTSNNQ